MCAATQKRLATTAINIRIEKAKSQNSSVMSRILQSQSTFYIAINHFIVENSVNSWEDRTINNIEAFDLDSFLFVLRNVNHSHSNLIIKMVK
jgi:hypothetical protein